MDKQLENGQDVATEETGSLEHGIIGTLLGGYLAQYVYSHELGVVCDAQTTFKLVGKPTTRQPDVSFIAAEHLPDNIVGQADFAPDLAVEVVSENDKISETVAKVEQYQASSVPLIWIIDPFSQSVAIYKLASGLILHVIGINDELDGGAVIPGFKLTIKALFPAILQRKVQL